MQEQCCCATYAIVRCLSVRLSVRSSVLLLSVLMAMCCKSNISFFLIFAVLVLRVKDCRPYTPFKTVKCVFPFICSQVDSRAKGHDRLNDVLSSRNYRYENSTDFKHLILHTLRGTYCNRPCRDVVGWPWVGWSHS